MTVFTVNKFISSSICFNHTTSFATSFNAIYSASVDDDAVRFCKDVFHDIKPPLKK